MTLPREETNQCVVLRKKHDIVLVRVWTDKRPLGQIAK